MLHGVPTTCHTQGLQRTGGRCWRCAAPAYRGDSQPCDVSEERVVRYVEEKKERVVRYVEEKKERVTRYVEEKNPKLVGLEKKIDEVQELMPCIKSQGVQKKLYYEPKLPSTHCHKNIHDDSSNSRVCKMFKVESTVKMETKLVPSQSNNSVKEVNYSDKVVHKHEVTPEVSEYQDVSSQSEYWEEESKSSISLDLSQEENKRSYRSPISPDYRHQEDQGVIEDEVITIESSPPNNQNDVLIPQGPRCTCDVFQYRAPSTPWGLEEVICSQHRSHQTKVAGRLSSTTGTQILLAQLEDEDQACAGRAVQFFPVPQGLPGARPGTFIQVRKVLHQSYLLLTVDCSKEEASSLAEGTVVGLSQLWLGGGEGDLELHSEVSLTCEDIKVEDNADLRLLCSTELKLYRSTPFMVSGLSRYLEIREQDKLVSCSRNGMVTVICRSAKDATGFLPEERKEVGTVTSDVDEQFMRTIIKKVRERKDKPVRKQSPKKVLPLMRKKVDPPGSSKSKAPLKMKFGLKKAFKVKPASNANVFEFEAESDEEEDPTSKTKENTKEVIPESWRQEEDLHGKEKNNKINNFIKDLVNSKRVKKVSTNAEMFALRHFGDKALAELAVTRASFPSEASPLPDLSVPPPNFCRPPPILCPTLAASPAPALLLPSPVSASPLLSCPTCLTPASCPILQCSSCPKLPVLLVHDLLLPPGQVTLAKVIIPDFPPSTRRPGTLLLAKIFTLAGTLHVPDCLDLAFKGNSDATPKSVVDDVRISLLNTSSREVGLTRGQQVTRAQLHYINK